MRTLLVILALCLLLTGCTDFFNGAYEWEASHPVEASPIVGGEISANTYRQLYVALTRLVEAGSTQGTIFVADYDQTMLEADISTAVEEVLEKDPIAAYAVEDISCDLGTSGNRRALAVQIQYVHDRAEIRRIKRVDNNEEAREVITAALVSCDTGLVLHIERYVQEDFVQLVEDYALMNPHQVMELPQVHVNLYPEEGKTRVVELRFSYQTSRETLKAMQTEVQRFFSAASLYVSSDGTDGENLELLYGFLMNRFDYRLETSITPSYHLVRNGGGDSRAFAMVYSSLCRQAGLECLIVSGTRDGEPWYWNIVLDGETYYHVDLLASKELDDLKKWGDADMQAYVWDRSAYPQCGPKELPPVEEI